MTLFDVSVHAVSETYIQCTGCILRSFNVDALVWIVKNTWSPPDYFAFQIQDRCHFHHEARTRKLRSFSLKGSIMLKCCSQICWCIVTVPQELSMQLYFIFFFSEFQHVTVLHFKSSIKFISINQLSAVMLLVTARYKLVFFLHIHLMAYFDDINCRIV